MVRYLVPRLATLTEHAQLLVQHSLELVGGHVGDTLVGLQALQLVEAPVQFLQGVYSQPNSGSLLWKVMLCMLMSFILISSFVWPDLHNDIQQLRFSTSLQILNQIARMARSEISLKI